MMSSNIVNPGYTFNTTTEMVDPNNLHFPLSKKEWENSHIFGGAPRGFGGSTYQSIFVSNALERPINVFLFAGKPLLSLGQELFQKPLYHFSVAGRGGVDGIDLRNTYSIQATILTPSEHTNINGQKTYKEFGNSPLLVTNQVYGSFIIHCNGDAPEITDNSDAIDDELKDYMFNFYIRELPRKSKLLLKIYHNGFLISSEEIKGFVQQYTAYLPTYYTAILVKDLSNTLLTTNQRPNLSNSKWIVSSGSIIVTLGKVIAVTTSNSDLNLIEMNTFDARKCIELAKTNVPDTGSSSIN
jgi:hypothetical protein